MCKYEISNNLQQHITSESSLHVSFTANWKSACQNLKWSSRTRCTTFYHILALRVSSVIQPIWQSSVRTKASECQRLVLNRTITTYSISVFQPAQLMNFFILFWKIVDAAQGCDWGGWDGDHCSSCDNDRHYSIFLTQDLHCQQTILLLHIPRRHKLYAVHGQGDWPHPKLAVLTALFEFWCGLKWQWACLRVIPVNKALTLMCLSFGFNPNFSAHE